MELSSDALESNIEIMVTLVEKIFNAVKTGKWTP